MTDPNRVEPVEHEPVEERIVEVDVSSEMETSFLEYAYSVIYSRALPDARDGLKPVQRRILYMMSDMGLRPDKAHVKCSRVVGEVMGKLHPHGDAAIYDALVRLAQDFSLRLPLIDGHGNFGSLDDGPAAPRYTEARLAAPSVAMTASLDENVVDFIPNYDNKLMQPEVLPAAIPNLLVNGASGIAVGMATNIAPHNLTEVVEAAKYLMEHPNASLDDIMKFVPGPDLPSGGKIVGLDGIRDAYESGRGTFKMRATASIENVTARKRGIVVTELPYLVGPEKVVEKISDAIKNKKLQGVSAVSDLTDRKNGLRLVIEVKTGFDPELVLERLYKLTPMEESFGINNVALVGGQPQTLGLLDMLRVWIRHRMDVVRRRSEHRLAKRKARLHLVEGLLLAIIDIDRVIATIRASEDASTARDCLMDEFGLSDLQATYILDLQLRRLTRFSRVELETEREELLKDIAFLEQLLADESQMRRQVCDEMSEVVDAYGTPRRTLLLSAEDVPAPPPAAKGENGKADVSLEVADSPTLVVLSSTGRIGRTSDVTPLDRDAPRRPHDSTTSVVPATVRSDIGLVTSKGRIIQVHTSVLPVIEFRDGLARGVKANELAGLTTDEAVVAITSLATDAPTLAIGTAQGVVKRVTPSDRPVRDTAWPAISLKDGDSVIGAAPATDADELVFITSDASLLRFAAKQVRPQGRSAGGMAGVKLPVGEKAVFFGVVPAGSEDSTAVVTVAVSDDGTTQTMMKVSPFEPYPTKGRATGGVRAQRFLKGTTALGLAWVGPVPPRACDSVGKPVSLPELDVRRDGSGVRVEEAVAAIG